MVASSSTFCPHLGRVIRDDVCCMMYEYPMQAAVSTWLLSIDMTYCQRCSLVPLLNSDANSAPASVQALVLAVIGPLTKPETNNVFDIRSLM